MWKEVYRKNLNLFSPIHKLQYLPRSTSLYCITHVIALSKTFVINYCPFLKHSFLDIHHLLKVDSTSYGSDFFFLLFRHSPSLFIVIFIYIWAQLKVIQKALIMKKREKEINHKVGFILSTQSSHLTYKIAHPIIGYKSTSLDLSRGSD